MPAPPPVASPVDFPALTRALGPWAHRFDVDVIDACASTNAEVLARADAGAPSGTVVLTDRQTAGRGRRGRTWHSAPGDSLTFSLLWRFSPGSGAPIALSLVVGLAVAHALEGLGIAGVGLKWPNDILLGNRKLAGVLIELQPGDVKSAIVGIGLNLRLPSDLPDEVKSLAVSLDEAAALPPSRETVLAALLAALATIFETYDREGFRALRNAWEKRHVFQHCDVRILADDGERSGRCTGVADDGALLLDTADGCQRILVGDVSVRGAP